MARIRTVKPEISLNEDLYEMEQETSLPMRFAWAVLPCHCDREGRFKWKPRRLGAQILPYDESDFSRVLDALVTRGMVVKYRVGDAWFGVIPTFKDHQVINNREADSNLPDVSDAEEVIHACTTREPRVHHAGKAEGKGMEHGREGNGMSTPSPPLRSGDGAPKPARAGSSRPPSGKPTKTDLDVMKDALADAVGYRPASGNKAAWGPFQSAAKSLLAEGARPEDVPRVAKAYKREWPDVALTAPALAKHWARFTRKRTNDRPIDPRTEADLLLQEAWSRARERDDLDADELTAVSEALQQALDQDNPVDAVKEIREQHGI